MTENEKTQYKLKKKIDQISSSIQNSIEDISDIEGDISIKGLEEYKLDISIILEKLDEMLIYKIQLDNISNNKE